MTFNCSRAACICGVTTGAAGAAGSVGCTGAAGSLPDWKVEQAESKSAAAMIAGQASRRSGAVV
jgi:hypothetical protein